MVGSSHLESYTLRLRGIRFHAHIGASREEREVLQELLVDVDVELPLAQLPELDQVESVLSYDLLANLVVEEGLLQPYRLLETYAARVVARLLRESPAERVRVAVTKSRVPTRHPVDAAVVELVGRAQRSSNP